ncbi:hypothetical protein [Ochrobactrum sp. Marseille-Q0166]|uniref:hypothetical protein n=1 Tax=Ochrobactrum sp. Marseille-Q0166 TaxID=2761105 RepID=UPI0016551DFB|nr:hypothetical protein [Ochrobactrum sp. Marseille-Q0166]MBC8719206.1 hypothetical protein [Ochrobactrum sp. Marseille-Q0166]
MTFAIGSEVLTEPDGAVQRKENCDVLSNAAGLAFHLHMAIASIPKPKLACFEE